jgi:hypothetical protein
MSQRFTPLRGGVDRDVQTLKDLTLADHLVHMLGTQIAVLIRLQMAL